MGKSSMTPAISIRGFTLVEVMVSMVFLLVTAVVLLQALYLAFRHYLLAQDRWKTAVELWNQVEEIRATHSSEGEPVQIIPGSRPLYRRIIRSGKLENHRGWEVLSAR